MSRKCEIYRRNILRSFGIPAMAEPSQIDIEPTVRCNLRCPFCQHTFWHRNVPDMTMEFFKKILDSVPGLERIKLQGIGEPLLHPDIALFIEEASRRNISTFLYTNGTAFRDETVDAIFKSGLSEISVSCDHFDPSVLAVLRPGLDPERYRKGVGRAVEAARARGAKVQAWSLLTRPLFSQLASFLSFVNDLGFERLVFQTTLTSWGDLIDMKPFTLSEKEIRECETIARSVAPPSLHVEFVGTNLFTNENPCPWPFYYSYITCEGFVQPCCIISDPQRLTFGDLNRKSFSSIWNSRAPYRLRRSIASGKIPDMCKACYGMNNL
jgi:MoaA/NifB/PqqE/SkfB family radical SAM enzyme